MNRQAEADMRRKTKVLEHAKQSGNVSHTYRKYPAQLTKTAS